MKGSKLKENNYFNRDESLILLLAEFLYLRLDSGAVQFLEVQFQPALAVVAGSSQLRELVTPRDLTDSFVRQREALRPFQRETRAPAVERHREGFALQERRERERKEM